jgi:hypothetical protein
VAFSTWPGLVDVTPRKAQLSASSAATDCQTPISLNTQRRIYRFSGRRISSADDTQNDKGYQVEQNDSYLEDPHPGVVKGVELIPGESKPPAVYALNPIMRKGEEQKPH